MKSEPKMEKDLKAQSKPQSKASNKKTSNRRSPAKKEKNGVEAANPWPPEPVGSGLVAPCSVQAGSEVLEMGSTCSPAHSLFQKTLSPADVLHVHSYAKGDYGEGESLPKEEKKSDGVDHEVEKDNRHVIKTVSGGKS